MAMRVRLAMLLILVGLAIPPSQGAAAPHRFVLDPGDLDAPVHSAAVAGSFNGWSRDSHALERGDDGLWSLTIDLPDGVHHYKFVINGDQWLTDPRHSDRELEQPDGYGGVNSAVLIGLDARKLGPPPPGAIREEAVRFDPALDAQRVDDDLVFVRLRAQAGDVQQATLEAGQTIVPMAPTGARLGFEQLAAMATASGRIDGAIVLRDGAAEVTRPLTLSAEPPFDTPAWAKRAVWYQVFPERFRNGDPDNDPPKSLPWTSDWWQTHESIGEAPGSENFYRGQGNVWWRKYGGDLQGLREALAYLRSLGVNAIYLNPVFEAPSQHKYDTSDFRHIDDNFGVAGELEKLAVAGTETDDPATWQWTQTDILFLRFVAEAHRQGFKVILDGVFNHVGREHYAFQDVLRHGRASRYADWFDITDWGLPENVGDPSTYGKPNGIQWRAWDGDNGWLPNFRKDDQLGLAPGPREHIFAITRRWMDPRSTANFPLELAEDADADYGIDGWRLDVANDIPHPFWRDWRPLVKSLDPEGYISGEIWSWAHPWLGGDQFDAVMNYQFAMAAQDFFVDQREAIAPSRFATRLAEIAYTYPLAASLVNQNLFDSHDTDRLASMFVNPDRPYDGANRIQDNGPDYNPRRPNDLEWRRMMQAVTFQMTYLGAPMVYYGSEAGMWSPDDPSNRQPMVWAELVYDDPQVRFNPLVFNHYQRAIAVRRALAPLQLGMYRTVLTDDEAGLLVFARDLDRQSVYVAVNRSDRERTVLVPASGVEALAWLNVMDEAVASVVPPAQDEVSGRPRLTLRPGAARLGANAKGIVVRLPAWGVAVVANPQSLSAE